MKQTFSYHIPVVASTAGKASEAIFDRSIEVFEKGEYLKAFHLLLDSIDKEIRVKYGNTGGTEFCIPHGPLFIRMKVEDENLSIRAPFVTLPEKNRIPMMRQLVGLNFSDLDLAKLVWKEGGLYFDYSCPLFWSHPRKIYYVLKEICRCGSRYDNEFQEEFQAERLEAPAFVPYAPQTVDYICEAVRQSCEECFEALKFFEPSRQFIDMCDVISMTLLKIMYVAHPQGKLFHTLEKAIRDMDRNIPLATVVADGKRMIEELQEKPREEWEKYLYFTETLISGKPSSNLQNIREEYERCYKQVSAWMECGAYRDVCIRISCKFYETYYYNQMQAELDAILSKALEEASALSWDKAAFILYEALENIMRPPFRQREDCVSAAA